MCLYDRLAAEPMDFLSLLCGASHSLPVLRGFFQHKSSLHIKM